VVTPQFAYDSATEASTIKCDALVEATAERSRASFDSRSPMKKLFVVLPLVVLSFVSSISAQDEENVVVLPDSIMEQVVRKVVADHVISEKGVTEFFIAERGIRREWLPEMKNITFIIVADSKLGGFEKEVHFFKKPRLIEGQYEIDFGFGDPDCSASGDTWQFEIVGDVVKVTRTSGGWGIGFSGHGSI
jgi:hypothetical protein